MLERDKIKRGLSLEVYGTLGQPSLREWGHRSKALGWCVRGWRVEGLALTD